MSFNLLQSNHRLLYFARPQSNYQRYSEEDFRYYLIVDFEPKHRDRTIS